MAQNRVRVWVVGTCLGAVSLLGTGALATSSAAPLGPVSLAPAANTPQLAATGSTQQVRQLVQCGTTMYAVGSFTTIKRLARHLPARQRVQLQRHRALRR